MKHDWHPRQRDATGKRIPGHRCCARCGWRILELAFLLNQPGVTDRGERYILLHPNHVPRFSSHVPTCEPPTS